MSSQETPGEPAGEDEEATEGAEQGTDAMASKLSRELSNWRRKRSSGRQRPAELNGGKFQSEPARTIKVRGHETLVIRKPKLTVKPRVDPNQAID